MRIKPHKRRTSRTEDEIVHTLMKTRDSCMTMQGPRSSLKLFDYIDQPTITFRLRVLNDGVFKEEMLKVILEYCQENGLGADRSQGFGQFDIVSFSKM